jgi:hypothetical protein
MDQSNSKAWQLATIMVPVFLTGWLTYTFSRSEDKIKQEIDAKQQVLSAQLSLSTELFKRRFDAYETLYSQLISLNQKLLLQHANSAVTGAAKTNDSKRLAEANKQTADVLTQLNKLNAANALHMSDQVSSLMSDAWMAGVNGDVAGLSKKILEVEAQMKKELQSEMDNKALTVKKTSAPSSP